jgi:sulfur carrier protein
MSNARIQVQINQAPHSLPNGATLADAIAHVAIQPPFAAAVNFQFVPHGLYAQHILVQDDKIELVAPITGG